MELNQTHRSAGTTEIVIELTLDELGYVAGGNSSHTALSESAEALKAVAQK